MSMFGGVAAHAVNTFRDPAIYDARHFDTDDVLSTATPVTPRRRRRRHGWDAPVQLPRPRPLHLDPTTGGLR